MTEKIFRVNKRATTRRNQEKDRNKAAEAESKGEPICQKKHGCGKWYFPAHTEGGQSRNRSQEVTFSPTRTRS